MSTIVNDARTKDVASARRFSVDTGMFEQEESGEVEQRLLAVIGGQDPGTVLTAKEGPVVVGAGYFAPEPFSDRCWNLYFLVVDKDHHGIGIGSRIVNEVEQRLRDLGPGQGPGPADRDLQHGPVRQHQGVLRGSRLRPGSNGP